MKAALDSFIASVDPAGKPVAVFDWDNTVIKNDVGAATVFHMVRSGLIKRPARWEEYSDLTAAAREKLATVCAGDGEFLPTDSKPACGRAMAGLYRGGKLSGVAEPFREYDHRTYRPTTAWQVHVQAGYTPGQVRAMAREVIRELCAAPVGATARAGGLPVEGYLRLNRAMVSLMDRLRRRGFEIWVVSASPQHVVETFAAEVGVAAARVIGIRSMLDARGRITHGLKGCGDVKDGDNRLLTYIEGKQCWIRKVIGKSAVFAAGDATTDIAMLAAATGLRLVIDRGYPELMCRALHGSKEGAGWLINKMLYEPQPAKEKPYPCSTTACSDSQGKAVPCMDDKGTPLADIN